MQSLMAQSHSRLTGESGGQKRQTKNVFRQAKENEKMKVLHASPMSILNQQDESIDMKRTTTVRQTSMNKSTSLRWFIEQSYHSQGAGNGS